MFRNSQAAPFRKFDKLWLVSAAFLGFSVIPAVGFVLLGPGDSSLLLSRSVVLLENLLALGYLLHTASRARGSARAFWLLMASVLGIWAIANVAWTYASYAANEFPINSIWWSFYRLAGVPVAMTFFLKDRARQARLDPELILDWTQITILVSTTYFVLQYLPLQQMSPQAALVQNEIGTNLENLLLLGGALVIFLYRRRSGLGPLFARLVLLLLGYSIVAAAGNYLDAHLAAPNSAWKDLLWSISYFLLPAVASTWEPSNKEEEAAAIAGRERSFGRLLVSNLALMTLLISIRALAEHMQGGWRVLGICTIAISLLIYAARLAVTQYSQQQEVKQRKNAEEALQENYRQIKLEVLRRQLAQEALSNERQVLHALIDNVPDHMYVKDVHSRFLMANLSVARQMGAKSPADVVGKTDFDFYPRELAQQFYADEQKVIHSGEAEANREEPGLDANGNQSHVLTTQVPLRDSVGQVIGLAGIGRDVTELRRAEDAARRAEQTLRQAHHETELLLNSVPSILIGLDPAGKIRRWNRAASAILGWNESALTGKTLGECGVKWLAPDIDAKVAAAAHNPNQGALNDLGFEKDGSTRFLGLNVIPLLAADGGATPILGVPGGSTVVGADITEKRFLEAQLRQSQKLEAIGQLAAGIAHEINTPTQFVANNATFLKESWTAIDRLLLLAQTMQKELAETGSVSEPTRAGFAETWQHADLEYLRTEVPIAIDQSLEGLQRVANIVRAMKEFSHPGTKDKNPIDVNHAIETTIAVARNEWKYVADVVTNFADDLPLVPCFPGEFSQVILNLLVNAAHAIGNRPGGEAKEKGKITISTRRCKDAVEIAIQDTGVGIPEEIRNRVFEPFFTTKPVGRGTGQGLSLAHSTIVKRSNGKIWFESEVGVGTTFFIQLPVEAITLTATVGS